VCSEFDKEYFFVGLNREFIILVGDNIFKLEFKFWMKFIRAVNANIFCGNKDVNVAK